MAAPRATVHRGRWTLGDRLEADLRELPVEVPPGTAALTVRLTHDTGVLDLGCRGPEGFRGWSGGARREYTVAAGWATPGYLPGELEPGIWHVWLRLHRIPPGGVGYEVTATTAATPPPKPLEPPWPRAPRRPARRDLPAPSGMRWLAGDLHSHTEHSDGVLTVPQLACLAASRGLDFLAVTDHNTVSHHAELPTAAAHAGIVLVPGEEVTTDLGHANVFGTPWVDFRRPADDWVAFAADHGGLISINHPLSDDCTWRRPLSERPRLAEIWHSDWRNRRHGAPLAWAQAWRPDVIPVGGSDFHDPAQDKRLGEPTTWLLAEDDDVPGVLGALAAGRTAVSAGVDAPLLLRLGDEVVAVDADGTVLVRPDGRRSVIRGERVRVPAAGGVHRLESHENEVIALCS
jgi:predicted metal-dependent phosphoesterase TrpH